MRAALILKTLPNYSIHYLAEIRTAARLAVRTWHSCLGRGRPTISGFCFKLTIVEYVKAAVLAVPTKLLTERSHSCRLGYLPRLEGLKGNDRKGVARGLNYPKYIQPSPSR